MLEDLKKSLIDAHLAAAMAYGNLSHSKRAKVGAVIVKNHRIISVGYNGTPSGWDNNCEDENNKTKKEVLHAEMNALMFAARNGLSTEGCSLIATMSPCFECSKAIYQSGIKEVFYKDLYRDTTGIDFLIKCNIQVKEIL